MKEVIDYRGHKIIIEMYCDEYDNPRDSECNLGVLALFHRKYSLANDHNLSSEEAKEIEGNKKLIVLPVYAYDHGSIVFSTEPFSCPWDSGRVGIIFTTEQRIKDHLGVAEVTEEEVRRAKEYMQAEVKVYSAYINGEVFSYVIKDLGGCGGYFDRDQCLQDAKDTIDLSIKRTNAFIQENSFDNHFGLAPV